MNLIDFLVRHELHHHHDSKLKQGGFFISPALAAIVLVAAISIAVFGIFRYLNNSTSMYVENNNLMTIVNGARQLKSGGSYANVNNAALQRIQAFGSMTGSTPGGTVRNGWNGTVVVNGSASELQIQYNGVPESACDGFLARAKDSGEFASPLPTCSTTGSSDLTFIAY